MTNYYLRIKHNIRPIIKASLAIVGSIYTVWGFLSLFNPTDGLFDEGTSGWIKFGVGIGILAIIALIAFISSSIYFLCSNSTHILKSNARKNVYVKFGDVFSPDVVEKNYKGRRNIVIAVNRCFDTTVDDNLISYNSLHGKAMKRLYDRNIYTDNSLNTQLQNSISKYPYETLSLDKKPSGNLKRYPCGTICEIKESDSLTYFFMGLSELDNQFKASASKAEFAESVQKMIEYCNKRSQGYPVVVPLLGTGLSRTNIPAEDALKYLVNAFRINRDIINCDFYIVVWDGLKNEISIKDL